MKNKNHRPWSLNQNKEIQKTINKFNDTDKKVIKTLQKKKIIFKNDSVLARFTKTLDREFSWLKKIKIDEFPVIFDVGSNIGINTICYKILFKKSKIYSFEPIPRTIRIFKKNIKLNKLKNIKSYNVGFSDKKKESFLSIPTKEQGERYKYYVNHALYSIYGKSKNKIKVKLDTVDNFTKKNYFKKIDFIKIDVEGHEQKVLEGSLKMLENNQPNLLIGIYPQQLEVVLRIHLHHLHRCRKQFCLLHQN